MASDVTVAPTLGHAVLMTQGGVGSSPGYDAIDLRRMIQASTSGQAGVFSSTAWKVSEASGGANMTVLVDANAGIARVDGTSVTHQGPYIVAPHSVDITLDVTTANATNPRIDMVVLQVRDHTHDASGANDARVRILTGTATSGATLDNRTGAPALPANSIRLADILVPATDTTISNAQIRDRRLFATGQRAVYQPASTTNITIAGGSGPVYGLSAGGTSTPDLRWECSGVPIVVYLDFQTLASSSGLGVDHYVRVLVDGVVVAQSAFLHETTGGSASPHHHMFVLDGVAAGNHTIGFGFYTPAAEDYILIRASASGLPGVVIYEDTAAE
jgi:hypothetical protein